MLRAKVREAILASLQNPADGDFKLRRAINLASANDKNGVSRRPDCSGTLGEEPFRLAINGGNWRAATLILQCGYRPPDDDPRASPDRVRYLLENFRSSVDFFGGAPALRLQLICGTRLAVRETDLGCARFVLELGQPWRAEDLDPCVLMARRRGKARQLIDALTAYGANRHPDINQVRERILAKLGWNLAELRALSHADRCEVFKVRDRGDLKMNLLMEDHPADHQPAQQGAEHAKE